MNNVIKFGALVDQRRVKKNIFEDKKSKQRYLDYVFKISLKAALITLSQENRLNLSDVIYMNVFVDGHTTATDGLYELKEGLIGEFKNGTHNYNYSAFYPPICTNLKSIDVKYVDSSKQTLVRAADIVANRIYAAAVKGKTHELHNKIILKTFP